MADNNPANFANLPKEKVQEIAAKGGHASHGGGGNHSSNSGETVCDSNTISTGHD